MILVVDASVALKWFFQNHADEADCDAALTILTGIDQGHIQLVQPPHFIAEVSAVLAREKPKEAEHDLFDLLTIESRLCSEPAIYSTAIDLSIHCRHHLFDTLYHAVALHTTGANLITADITYYQKAQSVGRVLHLQDFSG